MPVISTSTSKADPAALARGDSGRTASPLRSVWSVWPSTSTPGMAWRWRFTGVATVSPRPVAVMPTST